MSTHMAKKETENKRWFLIDAEGMVVGRLATLIATIVRGKHRPDYTPHADTGEFVIVINAEKVHFTGNKWNTEYYDSYSGYPGGLRRVYAKDVIEKHPTRILEAAVRRMVPRNRLGRKQMKHLKVYAGPGHDHQAQQPIKLNLDSKARFVTGE